MKHIPKQELHGFHDGRLSAEREREIVLHISSCNACRMESEDLARIRSWILSAGDVRPHSSFAGDTETRAYDTEQLEGQWLGIEKVAARTVLVLSVLVAALTAFSMIASPPASASVDAVLNDDRQDSTVVQFMVEHEISRDEALVAAVTKQE